MSNTMNQGDLAWTAFRYISNELSADEVATFEECLAVDQEAREELSRAVELTQALAIQPRTDSQLLVSRPWRQRLSWMTVGAAACLAMMLSGEFVRSALMRSGTSVGGERLAGLSFGSQLDDSDSATDLNENDSDDNHAVSGDVSVPSWLLAAVKGKPVGRVVHPDDDPDDDEVMEN
jgi:ferric-dicitrate binding protein FerR (iron transport regulator)